MGPKEITIRNQRLECFRLYIIKHYSYFFLILFRLLIKCIITHVNVKVAIKEGYIELDKRKIQDCGVY